MMQGAQAQGALVQAAQAQVDRVQNQQSQDGRRPRGTSADVVPNPASPEVRDDDLQDSVRPDAVRPEDWPTVKCNRYKQAYSEAIRRVTTRGIGPEFIARHDAFLASNCTAQADVCPRSKEELNLANTLVILGMNQGMASTFLPFACRKKP